MIVAAFFGLASCSSLTNTAASTPAGTEGATCARALVGLYNSQKTNGTISITNTADLGNILAVINSYNQLKANKADETYKTNFATGMVTGGGNIITSANATSIMNSLLNSTGLANVNAANIAQNAQTVAAIVTLLKALK